MRKRRIEEMKLVTVGTGGGAIVASNMLRLLKPDLEVHLFSKRGDVAYTACEFPYVLRGALSSFDDVFFANPGWFEKKGFDLHVNTEVTEINPKEKYVVADGERYPYDKAIVNTGAVNFVPPIPGLDGDREYYLGTDMSDARGVQSVMAKCKSAIIVGAGPIGLEVAEAFREQGFGDVAVVEVLSNVLPRALDPDMADILKEAIENAGVKLFVGARIDRIEKDGNQKAIVLPGERIKADFLLVSTGVRPNTALAQKAGLAIGPTGGIVVNEYLQTSDPDIYAVGDCVEGWEMITNAKVLCPLATFTNRTGRVVGRNIALGNRVPFIGTALPFSSELFGKCVSTVGFTEGYAKKIGLDVLSVVTKGVTHKKTLGGTPLHIKLVMDRKSQSLVGAQIIGDHTVGRMVDKLIIAVGEKMPVSKLSQYETVYSPTMNTSYDALVNAIDMLIVRLLKEGGELKTA
jgi:NADH oxidase (H2O2-forming)